MIQILCEVGKSPKDSVCA